MVVSTFLVVVFFYWWYQKPEKSPPGPRGLPLLGILPYLSSFPERDFGVWSKKYGPIMSVPMGWKNIVVLNDYQTVMETLVNRSEDFSDRPYIRLLNTFIPNGIGMITGGPVWRAHRRFGISAIRRFGGNKGAMERKVNDEAMYLLQQLKEFEGKAFKIQNILTSAVGNVIWSITFGRRYDYNDDKFQMLINNLMAFAAVIGDFINEHKSNYNPNNICDVLDGYLENFFHTEDNFVFANCQDFCFDLFVGTDTTSCTLRWALLCLLLHSDVQEKMQEEIDQVIEKEGTPSLSHREKMPYSCAVLHEVMRFRTLSPLSVPRCAAKDVAVRGYCIRNGTQVFTNTWQVHNDETNWKTPNKFEPERHLDDNGNFTNSKYVIAFGAGARVCMGEQLAKTQLWIFLITIIQRFRISVDPNDPDPPSLDDGTNALLYVPPAYNMIIQSR